MAAQRVAGRPAGGGPRPPTGGDAAVAPLAHGAASPAPYTDQGGGEVRGYKGGQRSHGMSSRATEVVHFHALPQDI